MGVQAREEGGQRAMISKSSDDRYYFAVAFRVSLSYMIMAVELGVH
jgi:hypothetical protein